MARFQGIKAGLIAATSDDDGLLAEGEPKLEKEVEKAGNKRRKLHSKLEKRIKEHNQTMHIINGTFGEISGSPINRIWGTGWC